MKINLNLLPIEIDTIVKIPEDFYLKSLELINNYSELLCHNSDRRERFN